jgi:hypothetical protein
MELSQHRSSSSTGRCLWACSRMQLQLSESLGAAPHAKAPWSLVPGPFLATAATDQGCKPQRRASCLVAVAAAVPGIAHEQLRHKLRITHWHMHGPQLDSLHDHLPELSLIVLHVLCCCCLSRRLFDPNTPNGQAWPSATLLRVGDIDFELCINPPTVDTLTLQVSYPCLLYSIAAQCVGDIQ